MMNRTESSTFGPAISSNTLIVFSTDVELDDFLALRVLLRQCKEKNVQPQIVITVGEGNAANERVKKMEEVVDAATTDGMLTPQFRERIAVLPGSTSLGDISQNHRRLDRDFVGQPKVDDMAQTNPAMETRAAIVEYIRQTKRNGGNVVYFELRPVVDSVPILQQCKDEELLDGDDFLMLSGSYNVRRLLKFDTDGAVQNAIHEMINGGPHSTVVFEAFGTYEQKGREFPKDVMVYGRGETGDQARLSDLARRLAGDRSRVGTMHRQLAEVWNRGLAASFVDSCIIETLRHVTDESLSERLKEIGNSVQQDLASADVPLAQVVPDFLASFGAQFAVHTERRLDGSEQTVEALPLSFRERFDKNEESIAQFSRNWKVLGKLAGDPNQQLIGDASLVVAAFHPEVYELTPVGFRFDNTPRGWQGRQDPERQTDSVHVMSGVARPDQLVELLTPETIGVERTL